MASQRVHNLPWVSQNRKKGSSGSAVAILLQMLLLKGLACGKKKALIVRNLAFALTTQKVTGRLGKSGEARMKRVAIMGSVAAMLVAISAPASAQFRPALQESRATADEAKASQQRIDALDDETKRLLNDFRADQRQLDSSRRYNRSLRGTIESQERQIARFREDISNVASLQQAVEPLMEDMVAAFEKFVENDVPFNLEGPTGRLQRATRLRTTLEDPQKPASEKYRAIIEAYKLENEFGRTINYFTGAINDTSGEEIKGEFLQVGRIQLIFKTEDDSVLKAWDQNEKAWTDLSSSYLQDIKVAMRMAKGQAAPDLFALPMKRSEQAQ